MKKTSRLSVKAIVDASQETEFVVLAHGYADYMRDYEVVVAHYDGIHYVSDKLLQFVGCVSVVVRTQIDANLYARSLSWPVIDGESDYFEWDVRSSTAQYGIELNDDKEVAHWSKILGVKMFKATIVSEAFSIALIFHDLKIEEVAKGTLVRRSSPL